MSLPHDPEPGLLTTEPPALPRTSQEANEAEVAAGGEGGAGGGVEGREARVTRSNWYTRQAERGRTRLAVKNHVVAMIGEFVGTATFLFFALGGTNVANIPNTSVTGAQEGAVAAPNTSNLLYIALSFGWSLAVSVWVFFRISGGLFNPAVSVGMLCVGAITPARAALLVIAQLIGAVVGAALISALTPGPIYALTTLAPGMSISRGCFLEMFATFLLLLAVLFLAAEKHRATFVAPIGIGLALFVAELATVYYTGGSLNPARSFGPSVVMGSFPSYHWYVLHFIFPRLLRELPIDLVGPLLGALLASAFYRFLKWMEYETVMGVDGRGKGGGGGKDGGEGKEAGPARLDVEVPAVGEGGEGQGSLRAPGRELLQRQERERERRRRKSEEVREKEEGKKAKKGRRMQGRPGLADLLTGSQTEASQTYSLSTSPPTSPTSPTAPAGQMGLDAATTLARFDRIEGLLAQLVVTGGGVGDAGDVPQQPNGRGRGRGRGNRGQAGRARGGENGAPRGGGRRANFGASLSSGTSQSSQLHPTASAFSPSPSATASGVSTPTPAPVNQTLVERLTTELSSGEAECTVCFESITRTARIYSCSSCYIPFHLTCITKWATSSVATSSERARLLATRDPRNPPPEEQLEGQWSCPNCNAQFGAREVPKKYTCFCGRFTDPHPARAGATPHSCNRPCTRTRPVGCKHPCALGCHPGPCPPCPVVLNEPCHCHSRTLSVRCSSLHPTNSTPLTLASIESLLSCQAPHSALLPCGLHRCNKPCHSGPCGDCEVIREKRCFCGKERREGVCGGSTGMREQRVEGCTRPLLEGEGEDTELGESWTGEYACTSSCDAPYSCGLHSCTSPCHAHLSSISLPCPRSPELVSSCPCGKTPLEVLTGDSSGGRTKCTDDVPVCREVCGKVRGGCGHVCGERCHEGECGTCTERVPLICRCGSTRTTRLCGEPYRAPTPPPSVTATTPNGATSSSISTSASGEAELDAVDEGEDEFKCNRVCKAMRSCGRHQCTRVCCPLSWQEALTAGAKGKGKRRQQYSSLQEEMREMEMQDPEGLHRCERVCGRKLNCGIHNCESTDHRGPCPPCLRADFDELVCNCGSTVVLPPIPCNFVIDCRHPCIRPSSCGHPQLPHACHEDPSCPPCPYLTNKQCACGKKTVPNVRCSMDPRKVGCGTVCGKLLRCGWHRCRKVCHPPGDCETVDDQMCLKPRKHCGHPCPLPCHFPSACSTETPCDKLITVTCTCGHLSQSARCGSCDSKPEGNQGRHVKCTEACALAKRNAQLADALGVSAEEKKESKVREVVYETQTLEYAARNLKWALEIEKEMKEFVEDTERVTLRFPAMKREQRQFVYEMTEAFSLRSESLDPEPHRSILTHRTPTCGVPSPSLTGALAALKKPSATLGLGSLKKALPERKLNNAIYLEGVLGYDEETLREMVVGHMRGLRFALSWITDEDVLISFEPPTHPPSELDLKATSISSSLQNLISQTGFCVAVESVQLTDDGRVVRGSWTPVASSSSASGGGAASGSAGPRSRPGSTWNALEGFRTGNAFASLGSSPPKVRQPAVNAWGTAGGVIGAAQAKPPRAVIAPTGEQERPINLPSSALPPIGAGISRVPTPSLPLPPPPPVTAKEDEPNVPDDWEVEDVEA
ncbi:hypothetical protein JCM11641_005210 [Rhodosporidiobolus odoratus]